MNFAGYCGKDLFQDICFSWEGLMARGDNGWGLESSRGISMYICSTWGELLAGTSAGFQLKPLNGLPHGAEIFLPGKPGLWYRVSQWICRKCTFPPSIELLLRIINRCYWTSFYGLFCHPYIFLGEMSVLVFHPFSNWIFLFSYCRVLRFFLYLLQTSHLIFTAMICNPLFSLPKSVAHLLILLAGSFAEQTF